MPGCRPPCVEIQDGWTNRQKWNYVKNLYQPNYTIDLSGNHTDPREVDDVSRVTSEANYTSAYDADLAVWQARISNGHDEPFEKFLQWQYEIGTTMYGNLPQHKKNEHSGYCWMPCAYHRGDDWTVEQIEAGQVRTRTMLDLEDWQDPLEGWNDHGDYYMELHAKGNVWGFQCTSDDCPYYVTYGVRYFYS